MKRSAFLLSGWICLALCVPAPGGVFTIDSGQTLNLTVDTNWGTNQLWMGINTSGNGLTMYNGTTAWAGDASFGRSASSSANFVKLSNYSLLSLSGALFLGYESANNSMTIDNGSVVYSRLDHVLGYAATADGNTASVSGSDSLWISDGQMFVGHSGAGNSLALLDGAQGSAVGSLYIGVNSGANNNSVTVSNAYLTLGGGVVAGYGSTGNRFEVLDGAQVWSVEGYVGTTNGANNNLALVSGSNALWTVASGLYVGSAANSGNRLVVTNGGSVVVYNTVEIQGSNRLDLERGGLLMVLSDFDASMTGLHYNEGSRLYVGGTLGGMANALEGARTLSIFSDTGEWDLGGSALTVGGTTSGNTLYVEGGGRVAAAAVAVGSGSAANGNTITVMEEGSLLEVAGTLAIGSGTNTGNIVEVLSGGTVAAADLVLTGTGNQFLLDAGGTLVVSNGLDAAQNGFNFLQGGTLETMGALTGLGGTLDGGRAVRLTGTNAVWNLGTNTLWVGVSSSSNALQLADGASLLSSGSLIGSPTKTASTVTVAGGGSLWSNTGNLRIEGAGNMLEVLDGGGVSAGQLLEVRSGGLLSFSTNATASATGYFQDSASVFAFDTVTNTVAGGAILTVADRAELEGGATLAYTGSISGLQRGVVFTNKLIDAGTLVVDGVTNATASDLESLEITGTGSLLYIDLISEADDLYALIARMYLADSAGFAPGSQMAELSDEIDQMADGGNPLADNMLNVLSSYDSAGQNAVMTQLYDRHAPTYAHLRGMLEAFKQARVRGVVPDPMLPGGPLGPHFYGSQAQGWIKGYGTWGVRDGSDSYSGYDQSTYGVLLGIDKIYGEILAGVAGGIADSTIRQDDGDESTADTGYGMFYVSWGTLSWFGDLNVGYGRSKIEDTSGTVFGTSAEYDADQLGFYLGGGREMVFMDDRFFLTPSAAFSGSWYLQESYTETSSAAVPRRVEEYDYLSLQSEVGLKASYSHELSQTVLVPEMHANWLHEFNADEEQIGYSLVGGTGNYSFAMQSPVEDLYELGLGLSWWMRGRTGAVYEWSAGIDGRLGDGYFETVAALRLMGQF